MQQKIPQLDAVRGIAILVVMVHNLHGFSAAPFSFISTYGWMGVDLFFVLSGFLITGILLDTRTSADYFRNFYARRCLRIWPLYYSVLLLMFVVVPLVRPQEAPEIFRKSSPWWSYLIYMQNFLVAQPTGGVGPLGVSWSLAVEELFYLVWPFVVRFLPAKGLRLFAWAILLLSPLLRLYFTAQHWQIYSNPFCRVDGLMAGALLAILVRNSSFTPDRLIKPAWALLLIAAPLAVTTDIYGLKWLTFSMTISASAGFVYVAIYSKNAWVKEFLTSRFLIFTGTTSYGLYLLHKLPADVLKAMHFDTAHPVLALWATVAISYLLAIASRNLLESPFLKLKRFFENKTVGQSNKSFSLSQARNFEAT
jgi:peptidoglycan/LPS O-acetylase OafA/YrhL